jgi:hypothetical protein
LWAKGLNAKDIYKEMFPVDGVKCSWRKAVHILVEKFLQGRSKVADDARPVAEVAETTLKDSYAAGFGARVSMSVEDMSRNKCFLQVRISHVLRFISFFFFRVY